VVWPFFLKNAYWAFCKHISEYVFQSISQCKNHEKLKKKHHSSLKITITMCLAINTHLYYGENKPKKGKNKAVILCIENETKKD